MSSGRFAIFLAIVLSVWAAMHLYVFWRISSVPWVAAHVSRRALAGIALVLWLSYPLARMLDVRVLEFVGANWIGVLFLLFSALLVTDVLTLGGFALPRLVPAIRGVAVATASVLAVIALVQGLRPPVVRDYQVQMPGLPHSRNGMVLVALSDLHLGTLIGKRWLSGVVARVNDLRPDMVVLAGDIVENTNHFATMVPVLKALQAPLGVWAVTGNHDFYAGVGASVALLEQAGVAVLRDRAAQVLPGLVVAGVDDLTARAQFGLDGNPVLKTLKDRPPGATIYLSHSPWEATTAAASGAHLMLSGHTHNGQIWPFTYLVGLRYPLLAGQYQVDGMTVIVCRGTGTWGPRMRLWHPSEILRIKLTAADL